MLLNQRHSVTPQKTRILTSNSRKHSSSSEANGQRASQGTLHAYLSLRIQPCFNNILSLVPVLNLMNPVTTLKPSSFDIHFDMTLQVLNVTSIFYCLYASKKPSKSDTPYNIL